METLTDKIVHKDTKTEKVCRGLYRIPVVLVNVYLIGDPLEDSSWFLVDAGVGNCSEKIMKAASEIYGPENKPEAIILTHGHFDHIGALKNLLQIWDVPVFAHKLEFPYLNGKSSYPPPDPSVGGGAMAFFSWIFPSRPIDISKNLKPILNESIPGLRGWKVVETPGHSPGHISLYREKDGTLVAGDAIVTVKQESVVAIMTQVQKLYGPPKYFTYDWFESRRSVQKIADLQPKVVACGHGIPLKSGLLASRLADLADNFHKDSVPSHGRYIYDPARVNEQGVVYLPPDNGATSKARGISIAVFLGWVCGMAFILSKTKKK